MSLLLRDDIVTLRLSLIATLHRSALYAHCYGSANQHGESRWMRGCLAAGKLRFAERRARMIPEEPDFTALPASIRASRASRASRQVLMLLSVLRMLRRLLNQRGHVFRM